MHTSRLVAVAVAALMSTGCASIIKGGGPQSVSIRSMPDQAEVKIVDAHTGNVIGTGKTPYLVSLNKARGFFAGSRYRVIVEKPGFERREVVIDSNVSGWYIGGNLLFGGLIGWLIVDPATGAMWTLDPEELSLELQKSAPPATAAAEKPVALLLMDDVAAQHPGLLAKMKPLRSVN